MGPNLAVPVELLAFPPTLPVPHRPRLQVSTARHLRTVSKLGCKAQTLLGGHTATAPAAPKRLKMFQNAGFWFLYGFYMGVTGSQDLETHVYPRALQPKSAPTHCPGLSQPRDIGREPTQGSEPKLPNELHLWVPGHSVFQRRYGNGLWVYLVGHGHASPLNIEASGCDTSVHCENEEPFSCHGLLGPI